MGVVIAEHHQLLGGEEEEEGEGEEERIEGVDGESSWASRAQGETNTCIEQIHVFGCVFESWQNTGFRCILYLNVLNVFVVFFKYIQIQN